MTDATPLWDFDDPAGSEQRLRAAADVAEGRTRLVLLTQVARALGLQGRYAEGHAVLDHLAVPDDELAARVSLERGRLLRSAGKVEQAREHFAAAEEAAAVAGLDTLRVDALHMQALAAEPGDRVRLGERALEVATASSDRSARDWDAAVLTDIALAHSDAGDLEAALDVFGRALAAWERTGGPEDVRAARWMVAWTLRRLGRTQEALVLQRAIKAELGAAGRTDPHVEEELALLEP